MEDTNAQDTSGVVETAEVAASPAPVADPAPQAPATVSVDVPAEHESDVQRFVTLLKSGEQWVVDNVKAALTHFEGFFTTATHDDGNSNT